MSDLDPRLFNLPASYLNAWCLSHPEQPVVESIAVLAQHAGCSVKHMTQILNEERELQVSHARGLAMGLALDEAGAAHLLNITALRHADAEASERLIQQIRAAQADVLGLPWEAASSQVEERQPRPGATAALGPALAALGPERPPDGALARRAVVPVRADQLGAAEPSRFLPVAPRLVELPQPEEPWASATWHGLIAWAREALVRAQDRVRFTSFVTSADGVAEERLKEIDRSLHAALVALARRHAQAPADSLMCLLTERVRLVGPLRAAGAGEVISWMHPPLSLRAQDPSDTTGESMSPHAPVTSVPAGEVLPLGYLDLPSCLRAWRLSREARDKPSSDGYIARRTGLPKSTVQDLLHGRVRFSPKYVDAFRRLFEIGDDLASQSALHAMADLSRGGRDPAWAGRLALVQRRAAADRKVRRTETEAWFVASRWYPRAIHSMADLRRFEPSTGWISRALGGRITWKAAEEALNALATLGLLRRAPDGRVVASENVRDRASNQPSFVGVQLNDSILSLIRSEIEVMDDEPTLAGYTLALPEAALPELLSLLDEVKARIGEVAADAEARRLGGQPMDRVLLLAWQCFPQFHKLNPRRRP